MPEARPLEATSRRYQEALAELVGSVSDAKLLKKLSEVLALLDFNSTFNRSLELSDVLDLVLYVILGETRAGWAGILLLEKSKGLVPSARRGKKDPEWTALSMPSPPPEESLRRAAARDDAGRSEWASELFARTGAALIVPLVKGERLVGLLLLGERDQPFTDEDRLFAEMLCVSAAASIDNGRIYEQLQHLNRRLAFRVYQLRSLFDITRELNFRPDVARVREVLLNAAMGHVLTTRAVLLLDGNVAAERGLELAPSDRALLESKSFVLRSLSEESARKIHDEALRAALGRLGLDTVVPLRAGESCLGALLLGPKGSGKSLGEEDLDFLRSLAAQAGASLDNIRLTRHWIEKQEIEKEMALAREIQRGLLPHDDPDVEGWDIAGINIPCLTVGGDYFGYVDRGDDRHWLVIADVVGKGTGAALIMASVHAALHALAGLGDISLEALTSRLNEIVYESTEENRYVTAFFGSLDARTGELDFVNAGHCYPMLLRRSGEVERLSEGSPVIGLLSSLEVSPGRTRLDPGDLLLLYTDGLSETMSPEGEELGDERILELLRASATADSKAHSGEWSPSREIVARLLSAARVFAAEAGLADDLTLMVAQRLETS